KPKAASKANQTLRKRTNVKSLPIAPGKPWAIVVNPNSGAGKTAKSWNDLEPLLRRHLTDFDVYFTTAKKHATELTREAISRGSRHIVAIGGDGTISEVVSGFFTEKCEPDKKAQKVSLGIIASGSGSDLIKTLKIPKEPELAVRNLLSGTPRKMDAGKVTYRNFAGKTESRIFINIAEVGIGGEVIEILDKQGKGAGGWLSYQLATLRGLLKYKNKEMTVQLDKQTPITARYNGVVVANGRFFGSGMMVAPGADVQDALFDVVELSEMSRTAMILKAGSIRKGTHIKDERVKVSRAKKVIVLCEERALMELDGELCGTCPVEFQVLPAAISVIMP
ncbi:MAG: diacylglycerol kinase family lipid kinase, partial [Leptospiraceae bacterium]|nr:diacylglycerol kinase family lipid kinase [Leptospiraceae bacterium]